METPRTEEAIPAATSPELPNNCSSEHTDKETLPVDRESNPSADDSQTATSSLHRPLTRSQTGTTPRRRPRADSELQNLSESKKRIVPSRKRQKLLPTRSDSDTSTSHPGIRTPSIAETQLTISAATSREPSSAPPQLGFHHASPVSEDQSDCRSFRSRAALPTPIPNLTKKSRGRRVPTKDTAPGDPSHKATRLYVCSVEGCGKCFHRGEHLKRHIRSIHTHEKPFKCTYPHCEKFFNRHDNLLQHLKVHREPIMKEVVSASSPHSDRRQAHSSPEPDVPSRSPSPVEPDSPMTPALPRTIYSHLTAPGYHIYSNPVSYNPSSEPRTLMTDMAISSLRTEVSSLRTEIPNSPTMS